MELVVESRVESSEAAARRRGAGARTRPRPQPALTSPLALRLLGPLAVCRGAQPVALTTSRKVRALLAYLALSSHAVARSHLCELLWDVPNDPRGELRWCLSKLRGVVDATGAAGRLVDAAGTSGRLVDAAGVPSRVICDGDSVRLDLTGCSIDALQVLAATQAGLGALDAAALRALSELFDGDFLQGLDIERSAPFSAWVNGQRRRFRAAQVALLEQRVRVLAPAGDESVACLEQWLQLAPFDRRAHEMLLDALARRGQLREGDEHLAATARLFDHEAQDWAPLGLAWRAAKSRHAGMPVALSAGEAFVLPGRDARAQAIELRDAAPVDAAAADAVAAPDAPAPGPARRASIAVMPFADTSRDSALRGGLADALAYDVITRLAKLRSVFVIAQGTVFALDERRIGAEDAGRRLNVDYVAGGTLRREAGAVSVSVQVTETRSARVVWADVFQARSGGALEVLDAIGDRIVASIANQIELAERNRAVLKAPNSLDAWEAHHRGLWHMYRFNRDDNVLARRFFERAVQLDPTFARPYAGLSFTHFQSAFLGWGERAHEVEQAYAAASRALLADEHDPAAHWALGRALWLRGELDQSLTELDTSVELSPNFALGHYTLAFVHAQSGDALAAVREADHSRDLSPFDPLLFAMLATRAMALTRLGRFDEAADWATKASARPNAHVHVLGIAAHCLALAGRDDAARATAAQIRRQVPGYGEAEYLAAFRFAPDAEALMRRGAKVIGF
jgi:DNA-binding SARP family transcriptional activator/TolB-like protein